MPSRSRKYMMTYYLLASLKKRMAGFAVAGEQFFIQQTAVRRGYARTAILALH